MDRCFPGNLEVRKLCRWAVGPFIRSFGLGIALNFQSLDRECIHVSPVEHEEILGGKDLFWIHLTSGRGLSEGGRDQQRCCIAWTKSKTRTEQRGVRKWSIFAQTAGTSGRDPKQGNLQNNPSNIYRSREGDQHQRRKNLPAPLSSWSSPSCDLVGKLGQGVGGCGVEGQDHHLTRKKRKRAFAWCHTPAAKQLTIGPCLGGGVGWDKGQGLAITPVYYWENNWTWQRN